LESSSSCARHEARASATCSSGERARLTANPRQDNSLEAPLSHSLGSQTVAHTGRNQRNANKGFSLLLARFHRLILTFIDVAILCVLYIVCCMPGAIVYVVHTLYIASAINAGSCVLHRPMSPHSPQHRALAATTRACHREPTKGIQRSPWAVLVLAFAATYRLSLASAAQPTVESMMNGH
jgi:hypothetical protein